MDTFSILLEALVPVFCLYYSFKIKKNPPKMGEKGLGTKLAMQSQAAWDYANQFGSKFCLVFGIITGLIFVIGRCFIFGFQEENIPFALFVMLVDLIGILSIVPLTNMAIKKKFGLKNNKKKK